MKQRPVILAATVVCILLAGPAYLAAAQQRRDTIPRGATVHRDLVYARAGDKDLLLDLYLPKEAPGLRPLVVWIHGGGWRGGTKDRCRALSMLPRGYAVASISYRLSGVAKFPAQIHDCKAAIRWLRANAARYRLNPDRIGVWGSSAGGHLVALLGTSGGVSELEGDPGDRQQSSRVQAVVDYFGPTDFLRMNDFPGKIDHDAANSPESRLVGGPIQEIKEKVAQANPITYVSKDDPPFLIAHGDKDQSVPLNQSELLNEALRRAGVDVTFRVLEGAGHGDRQFWSGETLKVVGDFFDRHLRPPEAEQASRSPGARRYNGSEG